MKRPITVNVLLRESEQKVVKNQPFGSGQFMFARKSVGEAGEEDIKFVRRQQMHGRELWQRIKSKALHDAIPKGRRHFTTVLQEPSFCAEGVSS